MPTAFDAHSHVPEPNPQWADHPAVICGTCEADWKEVLHQAAAHRHLIPMLGLHPCRVAKASPRWMLQLEDLLRTHRAGVGECGLDFSAKTLDREAQVAAFRWHLNAAQILRRPIALHCVRAWGPLLDLLREDGVPAAGTMVHAFSGSLETARSLQKKGVFLSFSGDLLKPGRTRLQMVLRGVDPDFLLLESDGTADLQSVIEAAAEICRTSPEALRALTWENGRRCFKELCP